MSFTVRVKEELLSLKRFEKSELAAIIKMSGSLGISMGGLTLSVTTENAKIARISMNCCIIFMRPNRIFATTKKPI